MSVIYVSDGAEEYVTVEVYEDNNKNITALPMFLSLGDVNSPHTWVPAEVKPNGTNAFAQILVDDNTSVGTYHVWIKIIDGAETIIRKTGRVTLA